MRVGITVNFHFSVFSGGGSATSLAIAETLRILGHDVTLINLSGGQDWWDDLLSIKNAYPSISSLENIKEPFDLVLEVSGNLPDMQTRQRIAKQCVWVIRKTFLLSEIEASIFPINTGKRNLDGLTAVWMLDQETTDDEIQYLETLTQVPVITVPFIWTPTLVEVYRKEVNMPPWIQIAIMSTQQAGKPIPWSIHIAETNNSASSSTTIPMVILNEMKNQNKLLCTNYKIHNAHQIEKSDYFNLNVVRHCEIPGLTAEYVGRQRIPDWSADPMSIVLSHLRFRRIRPYLLDTLWCGIPLVHNSKLIKELSKDYERYYYTDNSIVEGAAALLNIQNDIQAGKGMFSQGAYQILQEKIIERFTPLSKSVQSGWMSALDSLTKIKSSPKKISTDTLRIIEAQPTPITQSKETEISSKSTNNETYFNILYTDMWDDFNAEYNMFNLILHEGSKKLTPRPIIRGFTIDTLPEGIRPNILIFGPFGTEWKETKWSGIPKAHFTGENTQPQTSPDIFLNMGYPHFDFVDEKYIRLPLWMLEIDWFGCNLEKIRNPKPLPLDRCLNVYPDEMPQKQKFCAFVVTNPCNPVRNSAFHWLNQYKHVDSAGRLFNNIGDEIFAGLGGGGGELKKHEFLKKYKFCISYENSSSQGYTTEKLLHAKAAGCIPIYWGDPKVERDFDSKGFIDARKFTKPEELILAVKEVDENPELYGKMYNTPAIDTYKRDLVRRTFSQIAFSMLKHGMPHQNIVQLDIPRFIGAETTRAAIELAKERGDNEAVSSNIYTNSNSDTLTNSIRISSEPKNPATELPSNPVILTMANARFLPSLYQQLAGIAKQKELLKDLEHWVWLMSDVQEDVLSKLKETFAFAKFLRFPENEVPDGFPDYWNPQHFAWKIWIYNYAVNHESLKGRLVFYMDAGIFMCRWPKKWLQIVLEEGICALHDPRETNKQWCHDFFCSALQVTQEEKNTNQIIAGCLAFIGGNDKAKKVFSESYELSRKRDIIVGPKWEGMRDGKPYGHRHDQSILSIITQRNRVMRYPLDDIYCDESLRKTFVSGKAIYVHRGSFVVNKEFTKNIDECYVINLDRRADRLAKLYSHNPELEGRVQRFSAYDGRNIKLTPAIARLFKPNDFFWKKAILGCALSHLHLWWKLVHERPEIKNYLILEDDVKLQPGWEAAWERAAPYVPDDYDVVYLGGILPPNRQGFSMCKERVNEYISRVGPNQFFGQQIPNRYFHWCNYAYVLSRRGAQKVLEILFSKDGYWTSGDHMVCNPIDHINHYYVDPLVAGCYQDDDPQYQTSIFNDFNRVDRFDSDLWNNDERFSNSEISDALIEPNSQIDIEKALSDAAANKYIDTNEVKNTETSKTNEIVIGNTNSSRLDETIEIQLREDAIKLLTKWSSEDWDKKDSIDKLSFLLPHIRRISMIQNEPSKEELNVLLQEWMTKSVPNSNASEEIRNLHKKVEGSLRNWISCPVLNSLPPKQQKRRFVAIKEHSFNAAEAYEKEWLEELLGKNYSFTVEHIDTDSEIPQDKPIVIVQRPHIDKYRELLKKWDFNGASFYILHLSDEFSKDPIDFYELDNCLGIARIYNRNDIPDEIKSKVVILPLGYHWTTRGSSDDPLNKTPRLPFRNVVWSFFGTNWNNRRESLKELMHIEPHNIRLVDAWESDNKLNHNQYIASLLDTIFVPCPGGNNPETFRLYEALECGCVPIYVKQEGDDLYTKMLEDEIKLIILRNWNEAHTLIGQFMSNKELFEGYRNSLIIRWSMWKRKLSDSLRKVWDI